MKKLALFVAAVVLLHAVATDARLSALFALALYPLEAWVLVRAWPALRADLRWLLSHRPRLTRRGRFRAQTTNGGF